MKRNDPQWRADFYMKDGFEVTKQSYVLDEPGDIENMLTPGKIDKIKRIEIYPLGASNEPE